jgi:acetyl-CoA acetyltransferase
MSFNHDNQEGDGLATGIVTFAGELWREAGVDPADVDVASIYDDYPAMVLAQLADLGMIAGGDLARFARRDIGERRFPLNTWGGMLSAGQPGGPAGGLNGISEAVLQLQHRAGARQVKDARLAVATGYGMTMYRYGGTAGAAVLERAQ